MPSSTGDPVFARALQTYLTLHKRRCSYSAPSGPTSPSNTTASTTTAFDFSPRSSSSRHSSVDSSSTASSPLNSPTASPLPVSERSVSPQEELLKGKALEEIDQGIFASLEEMLRSETGKEDRRSRQWIETRLMQKEQELRSRHGK